MCLKVIYVLLLAPNSKSRPQSHAIGWTNAAHTIFVIIFVSCVPLKKIDAVCCQTVCFSCLKHNSSLTSWGQWKMITKKYFIQDVE